MKKRFLSLVLAVCMIISCAFAMTACTQTPPPGGSGGMTNDEIAVVYKDVAKSTWSEIGVSDPTVETSSLALLSSTIPDKKQETTLANDVLQIKLNANNMASVLYLIGALYENSNFELTNGVAKFSVSAEMAGSIYEYSFTIKPQLDVENNKVFLEAYIVVDNIHGSMPQYFVVDANYNFESKTLLSFRIYTTTYDAQLSADIYVDIELTQDDKNKYYATIDASDDFAAAVASKKADFIGETQAVAELSFNFSTEVQTYMALLQKVIAQLMMG